MQNDPKPDLAEPMHEAIFWRGLFVHRYAGVEHTVTELLLRAGARPEYIGFGPLPYPWPKKLARLTKLIDSPGPLRRYAAPIREYLTPLTGVEQHRHLLVHGMMSLNVLKNDPRMLYFKSHDWVDGEVGEVTLWLTIDELIEMTQGMGPLVQAFTRLVAQIFTEADLMPIQVADRKEMAIDYRKL